MQGLFCRLVPILAGNLVCLLVVAQLNADESAVASAIAIYNEAIQLRSEGNLKAATAKAQQALAMQKDSRRHHQRVAYELRRRNEFDFAADEFRCASERCGPGSTSKLIVLSTLASTLASAGEYFQAAEVMKEFIAEHAQSPASAARVESWGWGSKRESLGKMHYFLARHFEKLGDREQQMQNLKKAAKVSVTHIEALVAMHELKADDEWRAMTRIHIAFADRTLRTKVSQLRKTEATNRQLTRGLLFNSLNDLARLAACTDGDLEQAIIDCNAALSIEPDSPNTLETLARCHFAKGDYKSALKHQQNAVALEPTAADLLDTLHEIQLAITGSE